MVNPASPKPMNPMLIWVMPFTLLTSLCSVRVQVRFGLFVPPLGSQLGELRAQAVEVESELAVAQLLACLLFLGDALGAQPRDLGGSLPSHDDDAIDVGDDD